MVTSNRERNKLYFFRKKIIDWAHQNSRHYPWRSSSLTDYEVTISEVLLQQTRADTIQCFYPKFIRLYPDWQSLANARIESLQQLLQPIGLSNNKAKVLHKLSRIAVEKGSYLPANRIELEKLIGIGHYIASTILNICHDSPEPFLDTNMARVLSRYFGISRMPDIRHDTQMHDLARITLPRKNIKEFNWAVLDFGALVCKPRNTEHVNCILQKYCSEYLKHSHGQTKIFK